MFKKLFAPANDSFCTSLGLFVFRVWIGSAILINHGLGKLEKFGSMSHDFGDPLGVGHRNSLALAVFAEVVASLLLILGLTTRFAALVLAINLGVAFALVHKGSLSGAHSGELAFIYLAGCLLLLIAGGGRISVDQNLFGSAGKSRPAPAKK
jgi:putative oxidoreductase